MAMFGNARLYGTPGINPNAPDPRLMFAERNPLDMLQGAVDGTFRADQPIVRPEALPDDYQANAGPKGYAPQEQRMAAYGELPDRKPQSGGMFGRGFGKKLGDVIETLGVVLATGPFAPMALRDLKRVRTERAEDRDWELAEREHERQSWNQPKFFNTGQAVLGVTPDGRSQVVYQDPERQQLGERERLLAALNDPMTPPAYKAQIERVLNITVSAEFKVSRVTG